MLKYTISNKGIRKGQIATMACFAILLTFNFLFYIYNKTDNSLILMLLTLFLTLVFNLLGSKIYQIQFLNKEILIDNLFYKEKRYSTSEFYKITTFLAMADIYQLNLKNGSSYLFTIDSHTQAKNLFNLDSNQYARELTKDILERI